MKWLKKISAVIIAICFLMTPFMMPASAVSSSKSYKTGYNKGAVIQTVKLGTGSGRNRKLYTASKAVYVSEKVILDKFVRYDGTWHDTEDVEKLSVSNTKSIGVSGNLDVAKKLKLSTSISVGKSVGATYKVNEKKGDLCRLALRCDYVEITYTHYTYNKYGKETGKSTQKLLVPIPGTATYYVVYD